MLRRKGEFPTENLELTQFEADIIELLRERPEVGKHSARSAIRHLNQAWKTREVDLDMAVFRIFTAEEEAATALIYSINRLCYAGHNKINLKSHEHHFGVLPFIDICLEFFKTIPNLYAFDPKLIYDRQAKKLRITCSCAPLGRPDERFEAEPPLQIGVTMDEQTYHFEKEMERFCSERNIDKIRNYIGGRVKRRHSLLYASDQGLAGVSHVDEDFFDRQRNNIFAILTTYILVDHPNKRQTLVEQAVKAFVKMLDFVMPVEESHEKIRPAKNGRSRETAR
jgi:hypothetical protein